MTRRSVDVELNAKTRAAVREFENAAKAARDVDDALEEAESAGKTLARAIERSADDMIAEIDATRRAVDALELALDDVDVDPQAVVGDLKRMGLTAQEIEVDADELAAALKRIDEVKVSADRAGFSDLNKVMGETERTGRASSVAIGGIGGSISELPGIGNLGAIAESMGQLAEGALEGEINSKQLVGTLGVLGGTAAAMWVVSKAMQSIADTKAFNDEQVESFREAVKETADGLSAVNEMLTETEAITGRAGGIGPLFEGTKDITKDLIAAGVAYDEWVSAIEDGGPALDAVNTKLRDQRDAMVAARDEALRTGETTTGYERAISDLDNAIEIATETRANYSKATEENSQWDEWAAESTLKNAEATEQLAEKATDARERIEELTKSMVDATGDTYSLEKAELELADAAARLEQNYLDTVAVMNDATSTDAEKAQASRDLRSQEIATAEQALATAQAYAAEQGAVDGSAHSARLQVEALRAMQQQYPNNAAAIQPYIDKLLAVPGVVDTTVTANTSGANAALDSLIGKLRGIGANVTTASVVAAARFRQFARGGQPDPGETFVAGEDGPEIVTAGRKGATVFNAAQSAAAMRGAAGGPGSVTYVTQNFPAGVRPVDVVDAQRRWQRAQGPL
jgi:hypothetical protein